MLTLLVVLAVATVLFIAAVVATRDGDVLVDVERDHADLALPEGRLQPDDVERLRFGLAFRGYRMSEVDEALNRVQAELALRDKRLAELESALTLVLDPMLEEIETQQTEEAEATAEPSEPEAVASVVSEPEPEPGRPQPTPLEVLAAWPPHPAEAVAEPVVPEPTPEAAVEAEPPLPPPVVPGVSSVWPVSTPSVTDDVDFPELSAPEPAAEDLPEAEPEPDEPERRD